MAEPVLAPFAEFTATAATDSFSDDVWHAAKRCLLDYMAATLPGGDIPPATLLHDAFSEMLGRGYSRLYPSGIVTDPKTAAFINGAASHTIEFDDIFRDGLYHPGVPVISAALAIAEAKDVSGEKLLRGIISGYEVSNRLAKHVNPAHYAHWHTTGTIGTFGAAAASATILDLSAEQTLHALANAGTLAAGLQQAFRGDAMSKPMHGGHAAETGLTCALTAKSGVTGVTDMLEGERGFGNAMCGGVDWNGVDSGLRDDFTITRVTVKNHAACGHAHAAIDAAVHLVTEHNIAATDIERIDVGTYGPATEIVGSQDYKSAFEAKFSLPYCVAVGIRDGSCRMAAFTDEKLKDDGIRALAKRIHVYTDEECTSAFPLKRSAKVAMTLHDGRTITFHAKTRKGDPDAPLSDGELSAKYDELATPIIGVEQARLLAEQIWRTDKLSSVRQLFPKARQAAE